MFRSREGDVLYVGKAASLRKRLSNYLPATRAENAQHDNPRVLEMGQRAHSLEWIVTSSPSEALLLENNLIKRHRPPFNIRLRDDKSYPYIVVTAEDAFPRVMLTRQPHKRGHLYFGPYANAAKVRETLDTLGRIFPFRKCRGPKPGRHSGTPCLQYSIKRCPAPCEKLVSPEDYREIVEQVVEFLSGRQRDLARQLESEMKQAAKAQDFERAALYRDRLTAVRHVLERQQARSQVLGTADVIGMARTEEAGNIQVFLTREGILADRRSFTLEEIRGADDQEVFERFLGEYYGSVPYLPPEVVVPREIGELERLAGFLKELRGKAVRLHHAERGEKRRLQELATRNAALALEHERLRGRRSRERRLEALTRLQELLGLPELPMRIEGYDVSNLAGENIVASMVVFKGGMPAKSDYRRFIVRTTAGQDDFASLQEVVGRRFNRALGPPEAAGPPGRAQGGPGEPAASGVALESPPAAAEPVKHDPSFEEVPDLVLVDGGKGQLAAGRAAVAAAGLNGSVRVVSLAKREEEVFASPQGRPLDLERDDPALLLLQRVRDEAHRFALGFHRVRRDQGARRSVLDELPGVGEKRKRAILQHFGSPEAFLRARREEIEAVPGLPGRIARAIYNHVHKTG